MKIFLVVLYFVAFSFASKFFTSNSRSPLELDLPLNDDGKGRFKAQIKNFNPDKALRFMSKVTAECIVVSCAILPIPIYLLTAPTFLLSQRVFFPMLMAKSQTLQDGKWKSIVKKKGKHAFEYHPREINGLFSNRDAKFMEIAEDHYFIHNRKIKERLGLHFDYTDQQQKYFTSLLVKIPFIWSGYKLQWWLKPDNGNEMEIESRGEEFRDIDLLTLLSRNQYKFSFYVQFKKDVEIKRPNDLDLLTLEYEMNLPADFAFEQYQLLFKDGDMKLLYEFIKKFMPAIEMMIRNQNLKEPILDLKQSPLLTSHIEMIKQMTGITEFEAQNELNQLSVEELTDFLLVLDYLMVPSNYIDLTTNVLTEKLTFQNGCQVLKRIPNVGLLSKAKHQLNQKYKIIIDNETHNHRNNIEEFCRLLATYYSE